MPKIQKPRQIEGKPIKDATEPLVLSVRTSDIKYGVGKAPDVCAAAIACVRQCECLSARVHASRTFLEYEDHWVRYKTPTNLRQEIVAFDGKGKFHPGFYRLAPLEPSHRTTGKARTPTTVKRGNPNNKRPRPYHEQNIRERPHFAQVTVPPVNATKEK
jgi:hypothetical protein